MKALYRGIDVYSGTGAIDWSKVKKSTNADFAIIKCGFRGYGENGRLVKDTRFCYNIENALSLGVKVGAYFYPASRTVNEAIEEAQFTVDILQDYHDSIELPVVFDMEGYTNPKYRNYGITQRQRTDFCKAFNWVIEKAGYKPMLYGSRSHIRTKFYLDEFPPSVPIWCAKYRSATKVIDDMKYLPDIGKYNDRLAIWQYSSVGRIDGINARVDLNFMIKDLLNSIPQNPYTMPTKTLVHNVLTQYIADEGVMWMQWELVQAGANIKIDGKFGKLTLAALEEYQRVNGLKPDGKCGAVTKSKMLEKAE